MFPNIQSAVWNLSLRVILTGLCKECGFESKVQIWLGQAEEPTCVTTTVYISKLSSLSTNKNYCYKAVKHEVITIRLSK